MTKTAALTQGVHHIGLTVADLAPPLEFFTHALGFQQVGEDAEYPAVFLSDGSFVLTLWQTISEEQAIPFDRKKNVGLHHLALQVADRSALKTVFEKLKGWPGVTMEFEPVPPGSGSKARHFMCIIPGGIRVEFFAPASD